MSAEAIATIRAEFEKELSSNIHLYHPIDIERVRSEDWQVKRFIIDQPDGDVSKAFAALCRSLQWKKSFGLHDRTDEYFPKEIWELNAIEIYGRDKEERVIQWEAIRNQRSFKELSLIVRQFVAHNMERVDREAGETGFILITDANGGGIKNIDMDLSKFKIAIVEYYPMGMRAMYIVDQPWLLNAIVKIIIGLMSDKLKQLIHFVKYTDLPAIMDTKFIPVELKGSRSKHAFPMDIIPMHQLTKQLDLDEKFIDNFYKTYKLERTTT